MRDQPWTTTTKGGKDSFMTNVAEGSIVNLYEKATGKDVDFNYKKATTKGGDILAGAWGGTWFNSKKTYTPGQEGKEVKEAFGEIPGIVKDSQKFTLTRSAYESWQESRKHGGKNKYGGQGTSFGDVVLVGVGETIMSNPIGATIYQGLSKNEEWSRDVQKLEDQAVIDVAKVNIAVENIEKANTKLTESNYTKQADSFTTNVESFNKKAEKYVSDVEKFNKLYGDEKLTRSEYNKAISEQKQLQDTQKNLKSTYDILTKQQKDLESQYNSYNKALEKNIKNLEKQGIDVKKDDEGKYTFSSDALEKKVATTSGLLWKSYKTDEGKFTWKNYAYGGAHIGREAILSVAGGYVVGASGVGASVGSAIAKGGKVAKVTAVGLGVTAIGVGTGVSAYAKGKEFEQLGMNKIEGAVLGGTTNIAKVGGFIYGTSVGTKVYYQRLESNILKGKYTKSVAELRQGGKVGDKAFAKQVGKYETKIKGTNYKIDSHGRVTGRYAGKSGTSKVELYSKFSGKTPKGMPRSFQTQGQTLENNNLVGARLFTKSSKGKYWYKQDVLLKRATFDQKSVSVQGKPGYEGYSRLQRLKFFTGVKAETKPIKFGKSLPKDIFSSGEKYLFRVQKGKLKFGSGAEFKQAKPDSLFGTKQFVLYTPEKQVGNVKVQRFDSVSQTRGASVDLLKQSLKNKILVLDTKTKNIGTFSMNKRGQVSLAPTLPKITPKTPTSVNVFTKLKSPRMKTTGLDLRPLITNQLKNIVPSVLAHIVPSVLAQQQATTLATAPTTLAGITQLKSIIKSQQLERQLTTNQLKQAMLPKIAQVERIDTKTLQAEMVAQVQSPQLKTAQITQPQLTTPLATTPIIPTGFTGGAYFGFDLPEFDGFGRMKQRRGVSKKGRQRFTYVEDFTSKSIGLDPVEISEKQAQKLLKKSLTGLELRQGVVIK